MDLEKAGLDDGDPKAMCELGARYSTQVGIGLDRDDDKATFWYRKAAESGFVPAQHNYGVMLDRNGDHAGALVWFEKAAEAGMPDAIHALGQLWHSGFHKNGRWVRDMPKALTYYEKADALGYLPAKRSLAQLQKDMARVGLSSSSP
ncbi:hypothetical protein CTAYLR_007657 [Chrysophaeum taylorii]|uniref:Sel1 repeat family protein n=1 Tax=Chrysophaeum taylorii TaxID=2483200 RepID=A0AAD7U5H3_9STRA|nr:hypothetical protein CTAYLR_007657 [Chrysophaeum taylorii]